MLIVVRVLVATFGGYGVAYFFAAAFAVLSSRSGGLRDADAVMVASLFSFAIYAGVVLFAFAARSAWAMSASIVAAITLLAGISLLGQS